MQKITVDANNPIILKETDLDELSMLIKECKNFSISYGKIRSKLGKNTNKITLSEGCSLNINYGNTFVDHNDFLTACMLLRPFILNEGYYTKAKKIIFIMAEKDLVLKENFIQIYQNLDNIKSIVELVVKDKKIKMFFEKEPLKKDEKTFNLMKKHYLNNGTLSLNNFQLFKLYLNAFIFHRDIEKQLFFRNVIKLDNNIIRDDGEIVEETYMNMIYSLCLKTCEQIFDACKILFLINDFINNKKDFSLSYHDKKSKDFGKVTINKV